MTNVSPIAPQHRALDAPEPLRRLPGWLIWRYEQQAGTGKMIKVPYYAEGGKRYGVNGSPTDRAKLTSFADAKNAAAKRGFDGVGLAMLPDWGVTALDFDRCVGPDGRLPPEIDNIVAYTYAEYSPSGQGVRAFVQGALGNAKTDSKADRANGTYGFETFSSTGFVTFTGRPLAITELLGNEDTIAAPNDAVHDLIKRRLGERRERQTDHDDPFYGLAPRLDLSVGEIERLLADLDPSMGREAWVRVGMALHHETCGDDTGFSIWDEWSSEGYQYPGEEALRTQWDSFSRREGAVGKPITMATVIKMAEDAREQRNKGVTPEEDLVQIAQQVRAETLDTDGPVRTPEDYQGRYKVESAAAFSKRPAPPWLIKGVLPKADLVVLYGASGSGKTFVALDMAGAVARGVEWRGLKTRKCRVVLIAAEGGGGVAKRLAAYCAQHNIDLEDLDLGVIDATPSLIERDDVKELVAAIVAAGGADLCIMDTFAQMTAGADENSAGEMGRALAHAKALRVATGATVMIVHHTGKDASKGARGSTVIRGAADAEIEVAKLDNGRVIRITKQKDADDGGEWGFKLDTVVVGIDEDGDDVTSCIVSPAEVPRENAPQHNGPEKAKRLGRYESHIVEVIETQVSEDVQAMPIDVFAELAINMLPRPDTGRDTRRQNVVRAIQTLAKARDAPFMIKHGAVVFL